jgi:hypothetical protein
LPHFSATFSRGVGDKLQNLPPDKELIMHVIASDLIASDIAAEFDWSSAEVNQYLDSLLADDDNDWLGDADE